MVLPWLILAQIQNPEFFYYFFVVQQFSRYLTQNFNMQQPLYYYVAVILAGALPWTMFFFQSVFHNIGQFKARWKDAGKELYICLWPLLIFIFFSIPASKIAGYILPVFPPIAMMIARYLDVKWDSLAKSKHLKICSVIFLILGAAASIALIYVAGMNSISTSASFMYLCTISIVIMIGAVLAVGFAFHQPGFKAFFMVVLITTMVSDSMGVASIWTFKLTNVKYLAVWLKKQVGPGDEVATFNKYYQDLPVYLGQRVFVVSDWHNPHIIHSDNWRRELAEGVLYKHYQQPLLINYATMSNMWQQKNHRVFVMTSAHKVAEFKLKVHGPLYQLISRAGVVILSNEPSK